MPKNIVKFNVRKKKFKVGSWAYLPVAIEPGSGWTFDNLEFIVPKGPCGGSVSSARERNFDPAHPKILLCIGYLPGKYSLLAVDKANKKNILGEVRFDVEPIKGAGNDGPSLWFEGKIEGFVRGATWGGGLDGPENINITPHIGGWPVAILFVDTADHRYPDDESIVQGFKDRWKKECFSTTRGDHSVANYYEEVSYGRLNVTGEVYGPAHLPGNWSEYFNERTHIDQTTGQIVHEDVWDPHLDLAQACATAADNLIDFRQYKSLVMVLPPTKPGSGVWPQAWGWLLKTAEGDLSYNVLVMPNEAPIPHPTLAHELGHNLGLPDLYKPHFPPNASDADMQNMGDWDLMHWEGALPQMCILSRMAEGWIDKEWIKTYNFANHNPTPPVNENVTLQPLEKTSPPVTGCYSGIEIRLAAGRNYYVEYRAPQPGQISDQNLSNHVIVTDAALPSPNDVVPFDRPRVMFVHNDSDGDGPRLVVGKDFRDKDITSPALDPLVILVNGADSQGADVNIRYGPVGKPDPSIRPWPASPDRQWQSPDIEVRNQRNQTNPQWRNMPWEGHENTIIASVQNRGTLDAPGVVVNFYVQSYDTAGSSAPSFLGSDRRDVPAGGTVEFMTTWVPPNQGHNCISVEIEQYSAPGTPPVPELTDRNNFAQSNYVRYISQSSSPYTREILSVGVNNPLNFRTAALIQPRQTHPHYRTYLEHTYITLEPGQRREIKVMFEYAQPADKNMEKEFFRIPNHLSVTAFIVNRDPYDLTVPSGKGGITDGTPQPLGGVDIDVVAARATRFAIIAIIGGRNERRVQGKIVAADDGSPIPDGKALLIICSKLKGPKGMKYQEVNVIGGAFEVKVPSGRSLRAYYGGATGYGECYSNTILL